MKSEQFDQTRSEIIGHIEKTFNNYTECFNYLDQWGSDSFLRLQEFISRGKLIRGVLTVAIYKALGGKKKEEILSIAASLELLHAGFLMHDDVMDCDEIRRGKSAIHIAYRDIFKKEHASNPEKNGESFAVCLGNIAYFLAFDFIANSGFSPEISNRLNTILNREAVITGFGQMNDIYIAASDKMPDESTILNTYIMKTARYTFSLPLNLGSVCYGLQNDIISDLIKIGEEIGKIFQLRDDELNLFGEVEGIGKSVGSDFNEGKKTLIFSILSKNISEKQKKELEPIFLKKSISDNELEILREVIIKSGTFDEHKNFISRITQNTKEMIKRINLNQDCKALLETILKISFERKY
jgi:geranylgeranyl pyrophosphate synthase